MSKINLAELAARKPMDDPDLHGEIVGLTRAERDVLVAALEWIKNDLFYKAPEQVDPEVSGRIVSSIDAALEWKRGDGMTVDREQIARELWDAAFKKAKLGAWPAWERALLKMADYVLARERAAFEKCSRECALEWGEGNPATMGGALRCKERIRALAEREAHRGS
jgi:hypothetical protein